MTASAIAVGIGFPRCSVTRNSLPRSACAAVAPSATITRGFTTRIDELELLDRIGDVHPRAVDSSLQHRRIEQLPGGTDKEVSCSVLQVTGSLTYKHDVCRAGPFAEDGLGGVDPQIAAAAAPGRLPQLGESWVRRDEVSRRPSGDWFELTELGHWAHGKHLVPPM